MPTLLVLTPHPDDEAYTAGGLLSLASRAGWRAVVACATRGEGGERFDDGEPTAAEPLGLVRERELAAACEAVGAAPEMWGLPDGALPDLETELRHLSSDAIGRHRPDLVVTMAPDGVYGHPDHLALHRAVTSAWRLLPVSRLCPLLYFAFPRGLFTRQSERCVAAGLIRPGEAPADGVEAPHYRLPLSSAAGAKLAAISAHRTQLPGGEPSALFPDGIVEATLAEEWFTDADGEPDAGVVALFDDLATEAGSSEPATRLE